jgi:FkbM family methyltransferase
MSLGTESQMNRLKSATVRALDACLPARAKKSLLHLAFHLARPEFERFAHDYCVGPSMWRGLESLCARGFSPRTIIDVGAYEGGWSVTAKQIWPRCKIFMIEPNLDKRAKLSKLASELDAELRVELLGAHNGEKVHFNLMETGSSIMNERSAVQRTVEMRSLATLDSLEINLQGPALLKIDAQGYELEILRGSSVSLNSIEAVLLEIAIIEINEGAPLLHDVVAFMDGLGFAAAEILELHRRPLDRALSQIDVMFIRRESALLADRRYS